MADESQSYIEGSHIYTEGREAGLKGLSATDSPYPSGSWMRNVYLDGHHHGNLERLSRSEPTLRYPDETGEPGAQ